MVNKNNLVDNTYGSVQKRGYWENTERVTLQKRHVPIVILCFWEESRFVFRISRQTHMSFSTLTDDRQSMSDDCKDDARDKRQQTD